MAGLVDLMAGASGAGGLPAQLAASSEYLRRIDSSLARLVELNTTKPAEPELQPIWLPVTAAAGTTARVTFPIYGAELIVFALWFGSSVSGRHPLTIGETDTSYAPWLIAHQWQEVLSPGRLVIPAGMALGITPPSAAQMDGVLFAYPGTNRGRRSA